jgi:hypothetical protein
MAEPGPMPWPVPGLTADKYAAMARDIRVMSCKIALHRGREGDTPGALAAFREGIQSLQYIINNAGDTPHGSIDLSSMLQPASFAGTEVLDRQTVPGEDVIAIASDAIEALRYRHDWLRDGKRPTV